jgi:TRAP-type C4-dicarboxylate transport system permease small subunit
LRYFFNSGFAWVPEIVVFSFISLTLVGASTGIKSGVHIGVDVIVKLFPKKFQTFCCFFSSFCGFVLYLFMTYLTYKFVANFKEMGQVSTITEIPIWMMIVYMPVAFFFMAVHYLELMWEMFSDVKENDEAEFNREII